MTELRTPSEWEKETGITVLDPDGWRFERPNLPARDYNEKISKEEFMRRAIRSTVQLSSECELFKEIEK